MALLDFKALIHWKWFTWYQPVYDSIMLVFGYFENRFWFQHIHTPIRFCYMEQPKKLKETNYTQSHIKCTTSRTEFAWSFSHFFFQQFAVFCCTIQLIQFRREKKNMDFVSTATNVFLLYTIWNNFCVFLFGLWKWEERGKK